MATLEALQQDVATRPTGRLIGDLDRLVRTARFRTTLARLVPTLEEAARALEAAADAEMEMDLVRAELQQRSSETSQQIAAAVRAAHPGLMPGEGGR